MLYRNPQSLSEGFRHKMGSWKQTAQERSTWRGLVNKGAALYEKKSICEAERKHRVRKSNTNFMTLTCSTYNKVQVGKDQEKAQSEKKIPTPKTEVRKNQTNNQVLIP